MSSEFSAGMARVASVLRLWDFGCVALLLGKESLIFEARSQLPTFSGLLYLEAH